MTLQSCNCCDTSLLTHLCVEAACKPRHQCSGRSQSQLLLLLVLMLMQPADAVSAANDDR